MRALRVLLAVRERLRRSPASERVNVSRRFLPMAVNYYFRPVYAEFAPRTALPLYKSVIETLKTLPPASAFQSAARVGRFFEARPTVVRRGESQ